jgi:hypothetical protein
MVALIAFKPDRVVWSLSRGRFKSVVQHDFACRHYGSPSSMVEPLPVTLGDNVDRAVNDLQCRLIVERVCRHGNRRR